MPDPGAALAARPPRRPSAVLFDVDGVLVDSEPVTARAVQADLAARGLVLSSAEVERFTGGTLSLTRRAITGGGFALPEDWESTVYARIYAELARGVALIPGVEAVLLALEREGIPCAVGSNGEPEKMRITLGQHPQVLRHFQGHLYSGQALGRIKPDPALYLHAAQALGVAQAGCVVIEDSRFGCQAGIAAGMRTLGFAPHDAGSELAALGAEVFHDMRALPALLGLSPAAHAAAR